MSDMSSSSSDMPSRDFRRRIHELQQAQDNSGQIMKDLLQYCENIEQAAYAQEHRLNQEINDLQLDMQAEQKSRRKYQLYAETSYNEMTRNPYMIVLIDGDGLIFQDEYVRAGTDGGKKAAYALRKLIEGQSERAGVEVSAKIVANMGGLAKAMVRDGIIDHPDKLKEFMHGFTQAKASFDFVDVGYGKERADTKIKETTRWHLNNYNCLQILLGVSHDAGYAPFLDDILKDESTRQRVTVLEGIPTHRDIMTTRVHIFSAGSDKLFRTTKLMDRNIPSPDAFSSMAPLHRAVSNGNGISSPSPAVLTPNSPKTASPFSTFAEATASKTKSASPPPVMTLPLAPRNGVASKKTPGSAQPKWNPGPRGLDKPIVVNQSVLALVKQRRDDKLCNNHFLRGPCTKGDDCTFVHNYKPSNEELEVIKFLSRLNPCTQGQDCEADDCIYGHHCPSVKDGVCGHPYCKFTEEAHPPGTKFKNQHMDKNY